MTFAVIQTGGKQYKVKASDILKVERLKDAKDKIEFNDVLAYGDDNSLEVGAPFVKGAKVEAQLVKNGKNRTILVFKKRRRQNSRKRYGHRQQLSKIQITKILLKGGKVVSEIEANKIKLSNEPKSGKKITIKKQKTGKKTDEKKISVKTKGKK